MTEDDQMDYPKVPKSAKKRRCEKCDFECSKKSNWIRHILTDKHKMDYHGLLLDDQKVPKVPKVPKSQENEENEEKLYVCLCGKEYKYKQGLSKHKKSCIKQYKTDSECENNIIDKSDITDKDLIMMLIKENSEIKNLMMEVIKNGTHNITTTTHTNSHNKTFNLQVFLNDTCKDAMNIMEFVDSLTLQLSDLENVGKVGYVKGISDIIIKNLRNLDIEKRPVHCSDSKRKTLYIKDDNKWEKETEDKPKFKKAITYIAHKNVILIPEYKEKYPECSLSNSKKSDQYNKIIIEAMGGSGNNYDEKHEQIINNVIKEITINKNNL